MKDCRIGLLALMLGITVLVTVLAYAIGPPEQYVAGRIHIRARGITAEIYTRAADPIDGMSALWNGGKVTTHADLSAVQVGDMAELYTVEGEHLVLECIEIRKNSRGMETNGDVLVVNGRWVYRLTRL